MTLSTALTPTPGSGSCMMIRPDRQKRPTFPQGRLFTLWPPLGRRCNSLSTTLLGMLFSQPFGSSDLPFAKQLPTRLGF